jgi:ECF transporter S component (folate family)
MSRVQKSTALYAHPFSKAYWRDAAAELKDTRMLVVTALMVALRIALKPFAIFIGPQMAIQTATLATALGAMIFGPVVAIPAAMVSDTVGFMIFPTGDYFLPFMLTEIAGTMFYALCLYRSKPSATRVIIARFLICFVVNVVLQQFIFAWQYTYMGNPEKAKESIMGIMTTARIFKNLFFFPIESVVITLFLKVLIPITTRARLTYGGKFELYDGKTLEVITPEYDIEPMHHVEDAAFIESLYTGEKTRSHIDNVLETANLLDALYASAAVRKEIELQ